MTETPEQIREERDRLWNTMVSIAAMKTRPMNGHTAGNAIGRAVNAVAFIQRERDRRGA